VARQHDGLARACLAADGGTELRVRVVPRASRNQISGLRDDTLIVRTVSPPVEGAANRTVTFLLAEVLHLPRGGVRLVHGEHARLKRFHIDLPLGEVIAGLERTLAVQG